MKNLIAIDIGNTNITMGIFESGRLVRKAKVPTVIAIPPVYNQKREKQSIFLSEIASSLRVWRRAPRNDVYAVISSVVPRALVNAKRILRKFPRLKILVAGEDIKVPIKNLYKKKSHVGQDRLVNAFAAKTLYGAPAVVIDFGTAITFDVVSRKGEYLGGLILPGIEMGLELLFRRTALLPKVRLKAAHNLIGKDTADSMRGGILFGYGAMCDGLISEYRKMMGKDLRVIATGGNAKLIKRYTKSIRIVDEDLTLKGLFKLRKI